MKKKIILLIVLLVLSTNVYADELVKCEESKAHIAWSKLSKEEQSKYYEPYYCESNGLEDTKTNKSSTRVKASSTSMKASNYPSSYQSYSSPIRNQRATPTCWAMSNLTVLESYLKRRFNIDVMYSTQHMNYQTSQSFTDLSINKLGYGRPRYVNDGGGGGIAAMYYLNGFGPVFETTVPTDTSSEVLPNISSKNIIGQKRVVDVNDIIQSIRSNSGSCTSNEKELIKSIIYNYAPVMVGTNIDNNYYNSSTASLNLPSSFTTDKINHAVTIVGWDDNYSRDNFKNKPTNNGAWIVQNSWGNTWGKNGFYYISYEDALVCADIYSITDADGDIEDNDYYYSLSDAYHYTTGLATMNVFSKKNNVDEYLSEVSFQVYEPTGYKVYYYAGNAGKNNIPVSKMTLLASGRFEYKGYKTITPSSNIIIPKGLSEYSIVVMLDARKQPIVDRPEITSEDYMSGKSYYLDSNGYWYDLYSVYAPSKCKAVINAATNNVALEYTSAKVNYAHDDYFTVDANIKGLYNGTVSKLQLVKGGTVYAETTLNQNITANNTYKLTLKKSGLSGFVNGTYSLLVLTSNNLQYTKDVNINVIPINGINITNTKGLKVGVGNTLKLNANLLPSNHNSTKTTITWKSNDNSIATVDSNGNVTGVAVGKTTITATTANGYVASYEIEVNIPITAIKCGGKEVYTKTNFSFEASAYITPSNTTEDKTIKWTSTDTSKVTIDQNGKYTTYASGRVKIIAIASNGMSDYFYLNIKGVSLPTKNINVEINKTYTLKPLVIGSDENDSTVAYFSSSNTNIVTINGNGLISAKNLGTAIITVKDKYGNEAKVTVTVTKPSAASFTVNSIPVKTYNGKTQKPKLTVKYNGKKLKLKTDYTITYKNNKNPGTASIIITGKGKYIGTKTINFIIRPKKISIKKPTTKNKTITVKWTKHVNNYQVQYRIKGKTWNTINTTGTSKLLTGLTKGKYYQVRVRGYITINGINYYGTWSTTKTIKCK